MIEFSVIIPNTDSPVLAQVLAALARQTIDPARFEVLVVGSGTPQPLPGLQVRFLPATGPLFASAKRNRGMREAEGRLFLFLDDDCLPETGWLEQHARRHALGETVVGGAFNFDRGNYFQLADNVSSFGPLMPFRRGGARLWLSSGNLSLDRATAAKVGDMREDLKSSEDMEWCVRLRQLGHTMYFEPRAVVRHQPQRRTLASVWSHWVGYGTYEAPIRAKYAPWLGKPAWYDWRWLYTWGSPAVAAWTTLRTFDHIRMWAYLDTLPLVFVTKLAWCWSAARHFPAAPPDSSR